jgi:hypothetical protein
MGDKMDWSIALAALPGVVAVVSAVSSFISARGARNAEKETEQLRQEAQRLRDLEARNAERKHNTYEPIIDLLSQTLTPNGAAAIDENAMRNQMVKFDAWVAIYGSDDAVRAWHRFRQGSFHDAPPLLFMRLYSDFVVAARRDMGAPHSKVRPEELLGVRIRDVYTQANLHDALNLEWPEIEAAFGWRVPWVTDNERGALARQATPRELQQHDRDSDVAGQEGGGRSRERERG